RVGRSFFRADRCIYAEIADGQCRILRDAVGADQPPSAGMYDLADMPLFAAMLEAGEPFMVENTSTTQWLDENLRQACAQLQMAALLDVPVIKNGETVGLLCVAQSIPRSWTALEVELAQEIAERTWAAVERAKTEQALRESEERFRNLVESYAQAVWETDAAGLIVQDSPSWRAYTGQTEAEWLSEGWVSGIHPEDQAYAARQWQEAQAAERNVNAELRLRCADGGYCWTNVRATPIRDAQGSIRKWAGMNIDIHDRKKAEQAQRRSEERLRVAIDAADLGTWDWNLATNELRWNARHYAQLGLEPGPEPLTLDDFARRLHPADRAMVLHRLQAAVQDNQLFEAEYRIVTPQEELRWMSSHGQAVDTTPDGRVQRMSGVMLDVTERKHTEQHLQALASSLERQVQQRTLALRDSRDLLQSVYDTTLVGMAVLHAMRNEDTGAIEDFTFVSVNKELARMSGRPDLVGRSYTLEFPGMVVNGMFALMVKAVETGETQQSESLYSTNNASRWLASMHVKLDGGVVSTVLDITERKLAEQELLKSLRILEQSEQVAELGSWVYELATGELRWSAGMYRLFHLPPGTPVLPLIYLDYVVAADRPAAERVVRALTSAPADLEETLRLRVGNEERTLRLKAVLVRDEDGQPVRLLGVDLDMSQVQRLEADNLRLRLRQQRALFEAVQEAQEEERRRMSESLHNGIGQLLYATKLQLDCLPATLALAPGREAARLLSEAIQQTRALSHELTPAILEEFGLKATLQSVCRSLNTPALRWRCHLELDDEPLLPLSLQLAVYRLAQELAQNVLKHSHATEATLEVEMLPAWVVLRIEDNGQGFDPSRTSDGLGLRTLHSRVALLGGSV
ncbi:MAG: PAS domain S-box protein, partial [Hymenobacter sp.]